MRASDGPYLADWFSISLRWLSLLGLAVTLVETDGLFAFPALVLLLLVLWNVFVTILAMLNQRLPSHRALNILIDALAASYFFWDSGGIFGPAAWAGLLPLFSSAIYYEWRGGLLVGLLMTAIEAGLTQFDVSLRAALLPLGALAAFNLIIGASFGLLGRRLIASVRAIYNHQVGLRKETEARAQQQERERMRAFYDLTEMLSATLNYQVVVNSALDLSVNALNDGKNGAEHMVSAMMQFSEDSLQVGSARRFTPADMRLLLPGAQGAIGEALKKGEPVLCEDPAGDPEMTCVVALRTCRSAYVLPLISGLNIYGILLFASPQEGFFTQERREMLEMISHQAVIAIQNARLYQDLAEEQGRILNSQEEARKKLARDLHDGPTQSVAAIAMRANFVRRLLEKEPASAPEELKKIEDMAMRTTKELRHMLFTLRPLILESQGLAAALQAMAEKMRETYGQNVVVQVDPKAVEALEIGKQTVIFYLAEEAVNNARKHAQAAHIWVRLKTIPQQKDLTLLEVQDDGAGFDVAKVKDSYENRGSLGMVNLQERTELVNGLLNLESAPGRGTRVQVYVPLSEEVADLLHRAK